jgi:hypothetical protein
MKTRLSSRVVGLCLLLITAGIGFSSCKPDLVPPPDTSAKFGSIRVLNFVECREPFDIYIYQSGSLDTVIDRALEYSVGSAYATNLIPGTYIVRASNLNRNDDIGSATVTIGANDAKSVLFFGKGKADRFESQVVVDQNITPASDKVYVRFLNTKDLGENVDLVFDNPLNSAKPEFSDRAWKQLSNYVELGHALDTSYTMYLVKHNSKEVVSRLAGAAFGPGQFYTIVYGGNNNDCRDTAVEKADTLRLRYFDDNQQGNDLTFPIVQSLRFNIINGLIPPPDATGDQRTYFSAGVIINNDDRFLVQTLGPKEMARKIGMEADSVIEGGFFTVPWTDAIQVSMYANQYTSTPENMDQARANTIPNKRGIKLVDLRAGNRREVKSDVPFSIIVLDTVSNKLTNGTYAVDSSKIVNWSVVLPDIPKTDAAQLVLVNALAPAPKDGTQTPSKYAKMFVNGTAAKAFPSPQRAPKSDIVEVAAGGNVEIKVDIGRSEVLQTLVKNFTPVAGGIYEIVVVGQRGNTKGNHPEILIIHTNKKSDQ